MRQNSYRHISPREDENVYPENGDLLNFNENEIEVHPLLYVGLTSLLTCCNADQAHIPLASTNAHSPIHGLECNHSHRFHAAVA